MSSGKILNTPPMVLLISYFWIMRDFLLLCWKPKQKIKIRFGKEQAREYTKAK
jgi:hypothetical protein